MRAGLQRAPDACRAGRRYVTEMKMMALGMKLPDAIRRSTEAPTRAIHRFPELGTLGVGRTADIAVFELQSGVFALNTLARDSVFRLGDAYLPAPKRVLLLGTTNIPETWPLLTSAYA